MPDRRVQAAIDHWAPRFITMGVDYNDFVRTTARLERWADWLQAWSAMADEQPRVPWQQTERAAREVPRGEFVLFENGSHVCSNIPYRCRPLVADWMAEQLASVR